MGLSRNKVAVSEGAAGSPPFYGECEKTSKEVSSYNRRQNQKDGRDEIQSEGFRTSDLVVRLSVTARAEAGAEKQPRKRSLPDDTLN